MKEGARPPREGLARLVSPGPEVRDTQDGSPTLVGDFAVFNQWTQIDSIFEGRFMESVAPGAFTKTIAENRGAMRILLNHGHDALGNTPIAALTDLRETKTGAHYEAELLDGVPPLVISGLRKGQYGSSFRFDVTRDDFEARPKASAYNPDAIPERVIREARVFEFGPVTFPAYAGATAGVRSVTDEYLVERFVHDPKFMRALAPEVLAQVALVDSLIDQADDAIDAVMVALGIPDPDQDEGDMGDMGDGADMTAMGHSETKAALVAGLMRKVALIKAKAPSTSGAAVIPHPGAGAPLQRRRFRNDEEWLKWLSNSKT